MAGVADCALGHWGAARDAVPVAAWAGAAVCLAIAALARHVARQAAFPAATRALEQAVWRVVGAGLIALALDRAADLTGLLTAAGRCLSQAQGWYEDRRGVQSRVLVALLVALTVAGILVLAALRRTRRGTRVAAAGLALALGVTLVRAIGYHPVDALFGTRIGALRLSWLMGLSGLALICLAAVAALRQPCPHPGAGQPPEPG